MTSIGLAGKDGKRRVTLGNAGGADGILFWLRILGSPRGLSARRAAVSARVAFPCRWSKTPSFTGTSSFLRLTHPCPSQQDWTSRAGPDPRLLVVFRRWTSDFRPTPNQFNWPQRQDTRAGDGSRSHPGTRSACHRQDGFGQPSSVNRKVRLMLSSCLVQSEHWQGGSSVDCLQAHTPSRSTGCPALAGAGRSAPPVMMRWGWECPPPSLLQDSLAELPFLLPLLLPVSLLVLFSSFSSFPPHFFHRPILHTFPPKVIHAFWTHSC